MSLSGTHISCGYVNIMKGPGLLGEVQWSEMMTVPGTTTKIVPQNRQFVEKGKQDRYPAFEIRASSDIYVSVGPTPDATNGARIFVPANETRHLFCTAGDRVAWIAA